MLNTKLARLPGREVSSNPKVNNVQHHLKFVLRGPQVGDLQTSLPFKTEDEQKQLMAEVGAAIGSLGVNIGKHTLEFEDSALLANPTKLQLFLDCCELFLWDPVRVFCLEAHDYNKCAGCSTKLTSGGWAKPARVCKSLTGKTTYLVGRTWRCDKQGEARLVPQPAPLCARAHSKSQLSI